MRVKLRTNFAREGLTGHSGDIIDVIAKEGAALVAAGYAEHVDQAGRRDVVASRTARATAAARRRTATKKPDETA